MIREDVVKRVADKLRSPFYLAMLRGMIENHISELADYTDDEALGILMDALRLCKI